MGVGLDPSSELRVKKNRKETTIIEVNTIYSPALLNGLGLHMARPSPNEEAREKEKNKKEKRTTERHQQEGKSRCARSSKGGSKGSGAAMALEDPSSSV